MTHLSPLAFSFLRWMNMVLLLSFQLSCTDENAKGNKGLTSQGSTSQGLTTEETAQKNQGKILESKPSEALGSSDQEKLSLALSDQLEIDGAALKTDAEQGLREDSIEADRLDRQGLVHVFLPKSDVRVRINQIDARDFPVVRLHVSVTDFENRPLRITDPSLFVIRENSALIPPQEIDPVSLYKDQALSDRGKLHIMVAVDKSGSMATDKNGQVLDASEQPLAYARDAALSFLENLDPVFDTCEVVAFDHEIQKLGANLEARQGLAFLKAGGDTALYGVLVYSLLQLAQESGGSKAVVLLSDGANDMETARGRKSRWYKSSLEEGLGIADKHSIPVFTIGFGRGRHLKTLAEISKRTHATYLETVKKEELQNLYYRVRDIINNQYIITYFSRSIDSANEAKVSLKGLDASRVYRVKEEQIRERKLLGEMKDSLETKEVNISSREDLVKESLKNIDKREKDVEIREEKIKEKAESIDIKEKKLNKISQELQKKKEELHKKDNDLEKLKAKLSALNTSLDQRDTELSSTHDELKGRESSLTKRQDQLLGKKSQLDRLERSLNILKTQLDEQARALAQDRGDLEERKKNHQREKDELSKEKESLNTFKKNLDERKTKVSADNARLQKLQENLKKTQKELERAQNARKASRKNLEDFRKKFVKSLQSVDSLTDSVLDELDEEAPKD